MPGPRISGLWISAWIVARSPSALRTPMVLRQKLASSRAPIQRLGCERGRQAPGAERQVRGFRYSVGMLNGFGFIRLGAIATLALLCAVPAQGASADAAYAEARKAFLEAYARVAAESPDESATDSELLKSYPLYPYLKAARIRQALNGSPDSLARVDQLSADFIAAHEQAPVSRA